MVRSGVVVGLVLAWLGCGGDGTSDAAANGAGNGGVSGAAGVRAGAGASGSGAGGSGAAGGTTSPDIVTGEEPVDDTYGLGRPGCRADSDCIMQHECVTPGGMRPSTGCGTPCCGGNMVFPGCGPPPVPFPTPCTSDETCPGPAQPHCHETRCVQCIDDSHCTTATPRCNELTCVECNTDPDCAQFPDRPLCRNHFCIQCVDDSHCSSERPHCATSTGRCAECVVDDHCAQGLCNNNSCLPECLDDESCAIAAYPRRCAAQRCEAVPCTANAECPSWSVCTQGFCSPQTCTRDAECQPDAPYCVEYQCFRVLGTCHYNGPAA